MLFITTLAPVMSATTHTRIAARPSSSVVSADASIDICSYDGANDNTGEIKRDMFFLR
jgi:hypothetical protein